MWDLVTTTVIARLTRKMPLNDKISDICRLLWCMRSFSTRLYVSHALFVVLGQERGVTARSSGIYGYDLLGRKAT